MTREYYLAHKEACAARMRAYRQTHKAEIQGVQRAWEGRNRERVRMKQRAWDASHKEQRKAYASAHKLESNSRVRAYYVRHLDSERERNRLKSERRRNDPRTREKTLDSMLTWHHKRRQKIVETYGGQCACCGIQDWEFLAVDHVNGGGTKHIKSFGSPHRYYEWLLAEKREGFQVLCYNCNMAKNYGICPHKRA